MPATPMADLPRDVDTVVIGAGPAGIAAASAAAAAGRDVWLIDEAARPGGQIWRHRDPSTLPRVARRWIDRLDRSGARFRGGTTAFDIEPAPGDGVRLGIDNAARDPARITARFVILATGARERLVPFPGWTLPGVIGIGGAQALLKAGARFEGQPVVIAGSGPLMLPVAASLAKAGARVQIVAEQAPAARVIAFGVRLWRAPARIADAMRYRAAFRRARWAWGTWVVRADGDEAIERATLTNGRRTWDVPCTLLCTGYGLVGATELARLAGCDVRSGRVVVDAMQRTSVPGVFCAGEPTGVAGYDVALIEGEVAGLASAGREEDAARLATKRARLARIVEHMDTAFRLRNELRGLAEPDTILCRCEDVPRSDLDAAWTPRQAKLYTRIGMGPCQGRVCGPALELLFGWESARVRAPVLPVSTRAL